MTSKVKTILIVVAVTVVALAAAITAIVVCTDIPKRIRNFFDTDFRVMYGLDKYVGTDNILTLPNSGEAVLTVKGCKTFTYTVTPAVTLETDFEYTVGGNTYSYGSADVGSVIIAEGRVENGSIYFDCDQNNSLKGVLVRLHDDPAVTVPDPKMEYPFLLTVISGEYEIRIAFGFDCSETKGVTIDPDRVVF